MESIFVEMIFSDTIIYIPVSRMSNKQGSVSITVLKKKKNRENDFDKKKINYLLQTFVGKHPRWLDHDSL